MYSNNDFRSYELYHHGILGMKWGRRNGPPYPLGASDHSSSEKKAGWRKSLDDDSPSRKSRSSSSNSSSQNKEKFHLTDKQKTALKIGAAAVGVALAAYGGYKLYGAVKTVDAESLRSARRLIADQLSSERGQAVSSAKLGATTGYFDKAKLRTAEEVSKFTADTIASETKKGRTVKNIAKAAAQGVKNDARDVKDVLQTSKVSPFRNPFLSPDDRNVVQRAAIAARDNELSESTLKRALKDYEDARKTIDSYKAAYEAKEAGVRAAKAAKEAAERAAADAAREARISARKAAREMVKDGKGLDDVVAKLGVKDVEKFLDDLGDQALIKDLLEKGNRKLGL